MTEREKLRAQIDGKELLENIVQIADCMMRGSERADPREIDLDEKMFFESSSGEWRTPLTTARLQQLKALVKIQFDLLAKVLPDVKAVEVTATIDPAPQQTQLEELGQRLSIFTRNGGAMTQRVN